MKYTLILCLASLALASLSRADQTVGYPKKTPLIDLRFPDGWDIQNDGEGLLAHPKDDDSYIVLAMPLESTNEEVDKAVAEAKKILAEDYDDLVFEEVQKIEGEGVASLMLQAKGADSDGKVNIACLIINQPDAENLILVQMISSPDGFDKHADAGLVLIKSLKAHAAAAKTLDFAYPAKAEKPDFTVHFPADWVMKSEGESCQAISPDKFVSVNVLLIDAAEVDVALGKIKEGTGANFESVTWGKPEKNKDEALGLSAIYDNGVAKDGDKKYAMSFIQYVREGGDKFLVIITQHPLPLPENHAKELEAMAKTIQVRGK